MANPAPPPSFAIILTHNRPELLDRCVRAVGPQTDLIIVVDNASDPPVDHEMWISQIADPNFASLLVISEPEQPPNLSRLWNIGFGAVAQLHRFCGGSESWDLVMLCDDADVPAGWVRLLLDGMRRYGAVAACTLPVGVPILKREPDRDIILRMPGHAFALAGEAGLRADQRLRWWWCDTHLDWLARKAGGMVVLPGPEVRNERPNDFTVNRPELGEQAGRDGDTFRKIWGWRPW